MTECQEVFDPEKWERKHGISAITDDNIPCRRETIGSSQYCKYHAQLTDLRQAGLTENEVFIDLLEEDSTVFQPKFQSIRLDRTELSTKSLSGVKLVHPVIYDKFEMKRTAVQADLKVLGGVLGSTYVRDVSVSYEFSFVECNFTGGTIIRDSNFEDIVEMRECDFSQGTWIVGKFRKRLCLSGSKFGGPLYIKNSTFESSLNFDDATFDSDLVMYESIVDKRLGLQGVDSDYLLSLGDCSFHNIDCQIMPKTDIVVKFHNTTIENGYIRQHSEAKTFCDFSNATLGSVELEFDEHSFNIYYFNNTTFTNFDFTRYHRPLREVGWKISNFGIDVETANTHEFSQPPSSATKPPSKKYPSRFMMKDHVETYIGAKERAARQGDSHAASEFLIREMRAKRKRRAHELSNSPPDSFIRRNILRSAQFKNHFLDLSCGFGEKPWKASLGAVLLPIISGLVFFPLLGGVSDPITGQQYAFSLQGTLAPHIIWEVLSKNLYFSLLVSSTLGVQSLSPATACTRWLMAVQSLAGPFLLALFVFTLGKQVTR